MSDPSVTGHKRVLQRGPWFEEFEIGAIYEHRPGRTVTEADNVLFTTLAMNTRRFTWTPTRAVSRRRSTSGW
jgi:acyl dehydratase